MDNLIGFVGDGYVMIAADTAQARSIMMLKENQDKILQLDDNKIMAMAGTPGDRDNFGEFIAKNMALYSLRQAAPLSLHGAANFTRRELADALRSGPYQVNILLGGWEKSKGPSLYYIDYLAALQKLDFACQGYAGYFLLGLLDRNYKKGMSVEEGLQLMKMCFQQLKTRFVLNTVSFKIKIVDKDGVRILDAGVGEDMNM